MVDIRDWIASHAYRRPEALAQIDHATGQRFTYRDMDMRVSRIAGYLRQVSGLGIGDVAAVLAHNSSLVFDIDFACARAGTIFLPMNIRLAAPELAFQLSDAAPKVLFVDADFMDVAKAAVAEADAKPVIVPLRRTEGAPNLEDIAETGPEFGPLEERNPDDGWTLIYSSGTTGRPKGVLHTHSGVTMQAIANSVPLGLGPKSCGLTILPLFHISGLNIFAHAMFYAGASQLTMARFDPAAMLEVLADQSIGVTHFSAVPTIFEMLSQMPGFAEADLSSVEGAFVGGAPSTEALLNIYAAKGMPLIQGYGLTETGPTLTVLDVDDAVARLGSAGKAIMHVDIRLVDDAGDDVAPGEIGEVIAKGPSVIKEYFRRPEAQSDCFTNGWLRTGDMGRFDEDGFLYIVDRKKDMFISGGENVYPAEVENCIAGLDGVLQVSVVGVPDEKWGEVGAACVVKSADSDLSEARVLEHCNGQLARYKIPKHIKFMESLPLGGTGKVLKAVLRQQLAQGE